MSDAASQATTTIAVNNLPSSVTEPQFLHEVNSSGFAGTYDFAYLPVDQSTGISSSRGFVTFKTGDVAAAFAAAWRGSARFGATTPLDVVPSSALLGDRESTKTSAYAGLGWRAQGPTTLMVRNLPAHTTQCGLLDEVNRSGFTGLYDFAYAPLNRDASASCGYAFLNFKNVGAAAAFVAAWCGSRRLGISPEDQALNVVPSAIQGFRKNMSKWGRARVLKVKNVALLPFAAPDAVPKATQQQPAGAGSGSFEGEGDLASTSLGRGTSLGGGGGRDPATLQAWDASALFAASSVSEVVGIGARAIARAPTADWVATAAELRRCIADALGAGGSWARGGAAACPPSGSSGCALPAEQVVLWRFAA